MTWFAWQLLTYIGAIALLMLLARLVPYFDPVCAVGVAVMMFVFSAFRQGGFDYDEYLAMAELVRLSTGSSVLDSATSIAAKDPVFGLLVHLAGFYSDDVVIVIYEMALLAAATKLLFALSFRSDRTLFLGMYAIFLAPGIEFAAMRTGVALGFMALALRWAPLSAGRVSLLAISAMSHLSLAVPLLLSPLAARLSRLRCAVAALVVALGSFAGFTSLSLLPIARVDDYSDNLGTANAIFFPLLSLLIFLFAFPAKVLDGPAPRTAGRMIDPVYLFNIALLLLAVAIGAAWPAVTISVRVMELAWFFMLLAFVQFGFDGKPLRYWGGWVLFLGLLGLINVVRETWIMFSQFNFFSN